MNELRSSKMNMDGTKLWIVADRPSPIRMQRKLLFGLRKLMLEWDWSPFELYVDTNNHSLSINDFKIVHATAHFEVIVI